MGNNSLLKRVMSGQLDNAGQRGPESKRYWTDCMAAEDRRVFGIMGAWSTAVVLHPGDWHNKVCEGVSLKATA